MKQTSFILFSLLFSLSIKAQTVAYDASYSDYNNTSCIDLFILNPIVKGHQVDVEVSYFSTIADAQNNSNELPRFYSYTLDNETLYARVTNTINANYDTSEITIALIPFTCCPPPPNGYTDYYICDVNGDGVEVAYLENLRTTSGNIYDAMFCDLFDSQVSTTYYLTNQDAIDETNPISSIYTFTGDTDIYYKIKNTVNSTKMIHYYGLKLIPCAASNNDNDGIDDALEDANKNGSFLDDDTDGDGLKNYEDNDDDGDNILTIDEDYNGNGNPLDDDTNSNGIPDYLDSNVTLSVDSIEKPTFILFPNPVNSKLQISWINDKNIKSSLMDIYGNVLHRETFYGREKSIDFSSLPSGIYFLKLNSSTFKVLKK